MTLEEPEPKKVELTAAESGSERVEPKKTEDTPNVLDDILQRLDNDALENIKKEFDQMVRSSEWSDGNGGMYKMHMPDGEQEKIMRSLNSEKIEIDQEKEWDKYLDNLFGRASILIEGMTKEKAKKSNWRLIENLVAAWWLSIDSFRGAFAGSKSDILGGKESPRSL